MNLKTAFGTSKVKEQEGTWIDILVNDDGSLCRMRIARMTTRNKEFMAKIAKVNKAKRNTTIRKNETVVTSEDDVKDAINVFVESILLGWENVVDYREKAVDGQPLKMMEYNVQNAKFILSDIPDLFDLLTAEATKLENFQDQIDSEAAKN